jgi:hypothetical protein
LTPLPCNGEISRPKEGYIFSDRAKNIGQFIDRLKLKQVTAVAHPTGAVGLILRAPKTQEFPETHFNGINATD